MQDVIPIGKTASVDEDIPIYLCKFIYANDEELYPADSFSFKTEKESYPHDRLGKSPRWT